MSSYNSTLQRLIVRFAKSVAIPLNATLVLAGCVVEPYPYDTYGYYNGYPPYYQNYYGEPGYFPEANVFLGFGDFDHGNHGFEHGDFERGDVRHNTFGHRHYRGAYHQRGGSFFDSDRNRH